MTGELYFCLRRAHIIANIVLGKTSHMGQESELKNYIRCNREN